MPPKKLSKAAEEAKRNAENNPPEGPKATRRELLGYITCILCKGLF